MINTENVLCIRTQLRYSIIMKTSNHTRVHPVRTERHHGSIWVYRCHIDRVHIATRDLRHITHALPWCRSARAGSASACHLGRENTERARGPPGHTQCIIEACVKTNS